MVLFSIIKDIPPQILRNLFDFFLYLLILPPNLCDHNLTLFHLKIIYLGLHRILIIKLYQKFPLFHCTDFWEP